MDEILKSNGLTHEQLHKSITLVATSEKTIYSYENTLVAEVDGKSFRRFEPITAEETESEMSE